MFYTPNLIYSLLFVFMFFTSCNGQNKPQTQEIAGTPKTITNGHPKLIKTQGSTQFDNIRCGLQDKAGNMWFGTTREGVYRYDGKSFTQFTKKDGLNSNTVWSILEDKAGNIWLGTDAGICRYDPKQAVGKTIINVPIITNFMTTVSNNNYNDYGSKKNAVWSIFQDKTGKIWFGTGEGVYCYNGKTFTHFLQNDGVINREHLHLKMVDCILDDTNGNIWFASGMPPGMEGVCRFDGKTISRFKPNGDGWIRTIIEDKKGNLWFGGRQNGNFCYDGKTFTNFTEKVGIGNPMLSDKSGNIWFNGGEKDNGFNGDGGVWCYDGKSFKNFTVKDGLGDYSVWCMIEDRDGNIWVGTRNTGLYRYDPKQPVGKAFTDFSENANKK